MRNNKRNAKLGKKAPGENSRMIARASRLRIGRKVVLTEIDGSGLWMNDCSNGFVGRVVKLRDGWWDAVIRIPSRNHKKGWAYFGVFDYQIRVVK